MNPTPIFEKGTRVKAMFRPRGEVVEMSLLFPGFVWVRFDGDQKAIRIAASQLKEIEAKPGEPGKESTT